MAITTTRADLAPGHYVILGRPDDDRFTVRWCSTNGYYAEDTTDTAGARAYMGAFTRFGYIADKIAF